MCQDAAFSPSFGNRPSSLVGRQSVIDAFLAGLQSAPGVRERAIVLLGQRGSGKTVLLWELADRAAELGFVVATPTIVSEDMLGRIVEKIQDKGEKYVGQLAPTVKGGSVSALGFSVGLEFSREVQETKGFSFKLTKLARRFTERGHGILILVDELQANSPEVRQLVSVYQEMVGERLDVALVIAGLPGAVSATLNDHVLTFLNHARKMSLGPLPTSEINAFFASAFTQLELVVTAEQRQRAAEFAQGSPYLLQLAGHNIVLLADEKGELSEVALNEALAMAQSDFESDVCGTTLAALSERDVEFLEAMSTDDGPSRVSDVAERMGVTTDYAQKYRKRLIDAGIIEPARRGFVAFAVPYLRERLRHED